MKNQPPYDPQESLELFQRVDNLLGDSPAPAKKSPRSIDVSQYTPADSADDVGTVYHNFSNNYGHPDEYRDYGAEEQAPAPRKRNPRRKKRPAGCCGCGCATVLTFFAALALAVALIVSNLFEMPMAEESLGPRKDNTAAILLCGTDKDGTRTDTMMLVYLDGNENRVGLLSLPRDTLTITDSGKRAKLNSAYGRNGCGEKGMDWTMTYVQRIIGYRPDGYILVDMELVPKIVDLMGGVDVHLDHHIRINNDGEEEIYVPKGDQHLDGREVLATLRYRYGYADADLGRVKVQRMVITECMKQWVTPAKLTLLPDALELIESESLTNLSAENFLWVGKTILAGMDNMTSDTLPGYADMRGGASYFILYPKKVAQLINESYNPYTVEIERDDLNIAE
jgi:LCP family protein required for cell wall assembly